ncbi:hypothetical protein P3T36_004978 [Kitasatospora sp. MAP12-15]|uniref:hypothetical protein n=1 Tax=unclassified Kitasatospora TaxID=2633591 RepID=UPI00247574FB|nr:hypothetical protein [Kitasatospora sp. MAP12-44]MDH6112045.1 hypothetical protein [Kitasatospora sp. MAP12-44]
MPESRAAQRGPRLLAVQGSDRRVGWSLAAGNGRQLAVSARMYRGEVELATALRELMIERAALRYALTQDAARAWRWSAFLPPRSTRPGSGVEEPVARSARGYLRRDQCRQGLESFRAGLHSLERELKSTGWQGRWPW